MPHTGMSDTFKGLKSLHTIVHSNWVLGKGKILNTGSKVRHEVLNTL